MSAPVPLTGQTLSIRLAAAVAAHKRGELSQARALYAAILETNPDCFDALHLLGVVALDTGATDTAIGLIRRALAIDPRRANAQFSHARALLAAGDQDGALACLGIATDLQPAFVDAWFLRANILLQAGQFEAAVNFYERAILLRPAFPEALSNLSVALRALHRTELALEYADRAVALRPDYAQALNNRGLALLDAQRFGEAADSLREAVRIHPRYAQALHNLGTVLLQAGRYVEAIDAFTQLMHIEPGFRHVVGNLVHAKLGCCDWTGLEPLSDDLIAAVGAGDHADLPLPFLCVSDSAPLQLRCAETYVQSHFPGEVSSPSRLLQRPGDRIRVAYLSGDFGEHAVTYLLAGVLEAHDASRFEITALAWNRQGEGAPRRRVERAVSRFVDVTAQSDARVAGLIRELGIDIAVDLTGHTADHRTAILAGRSAPVQVNFLGFPATMGARYMDYLIADRFVVPAASRQHYAEQVVWLPDCFQPNDGRCAQTGNPGSRADHGLPESGLVFCSFNGNHKLNPACLDVWARIVNAVPGSVLWLLARTGTAQDNLRRQIALRGLDPDRVIFAKPLPYDVYLARYVHADLFLDAFPFNGGATASDALTMGVPVLTCSGEAFASRMAGSLLTCLGLPGLVTRSLQEYERVALELAFDPGRLSAIRHQLQQCRSTHAYFDTTRYVRHLESAYRSMWERCAAGLAPAPIEVSAIPRDRAPP